ncbi:MAG: DUF3047 domain-containing protein [Hydrogenophaga sp.]|nr:DUF3047 domain-containing protein [Hydrogenophaga sp.]
MARSCHHEPGTVAGSPSTDRICKRVPDRGTADQGQCCDHVRDVRGDLQRVFGEEPSPSRAGLDAGDRQHAQPARGPVWCFDPGTGLG